MNNRLQLGVTIALAVLVGVLGTALFMRGGPGRFAMAQESSANYMIGLISSSQRSADVPIVLVDTRAQVLLVYQYNTASESMKLIQARSYRWDRQLTEYPAKVRGPSVKAVEEYVKRNPPE